MKRYIVFGTGHDGMELLGHIGKGRVAFFCDNNPEKVGKYIEEIEIISFDKLLEIHKSYCIILAVGFKHDIRIQFKNAGIDNYIEYISDVPKQNRQIGGGIKTEMDYMLDDFVGRNIDSVLDFDKFRECVSECKEKLNGKYAFYSGSFAESNLYGHGKALMDYAGIENQESNVFPLVAHGSFFGAYPETSSAVIFTNQCDKKVHNNSFPYIPAFTVGPFIAYAKNVYSSEMFIKKKQKCGKTVLVFAAHGTEGSGSRFDEKELIKNIVRMKENYDTVMYCTYWFDADKSLVGKLIGEGIMVVSAGFRFDTRFIHNLKTIFDFTDDVYVYGYTSAVIYALYLQKNIRCYDIGQEYYINNLSKWIPRVLSFDMGEDGMHKIFFKRMGGENKEDFTEDEEKMIEKCYGLGEVKSKKEIQLIYQISKRIWENCDFRSLDYPHGVYKTYLEYQKEYDFEKLEVLSNALGKGFWSI